MASLLALLIDMAVLSIVNMYQIPAEFTVNDMGTSAWIVLPMIAVNLPLFYRDVKRNRALAPVAGALMLGYILRVLLLCFDLFYRDVYTLPNSGADSERFYGHALWVAAGTEKGGMLFSNVLGVLFKVTGVSRIFGQYLSSIVCSVAAMAALAGTLDLLEVEKRLRSRIMVIIALIPNFAILSSILLREALVTMFVSISVYLFVRWTVKKREADYFLAVVSAVLGAAFHSGVIALAAGQLIMRLIYNNRTGKFQLAPANIAATVVLSAISLYVLSRYGDVLLHKFNNTDSLEDIANVSSRAKSTYAQYVGDSRSAPRMLLYTLPRIFYFQFSPLPWQWRGIPDIIAFFGSSLFYLFGTVRILTYFLKNWHRKKDRRMLMLLALMLMVLFVFGWGVSNTGTAARHRDKIIALFAAVFAMAEQGLNARVKKPAVRGRVALSGEARRELIALLAGEAERLRVAEAAAGRTSPEGGGPGRDPEGG